jgi:all-trans-retinol dehydrogenase (NAD+)
MEIFLQLVGNNTKSMVTVVLNDADYLYIMSVIRGSIILITGGNSGLGKLLASGSLKEQASKVIIWDINLPAPDLSTEYSSKIFYYKVDVSDAELVKSTATKVMTEHGVPDIIINNAGIVTGRSFAQHSFDDITKIMDVNAIGPMIVARSFLPSMIERNSGHIVNIASAASLTPNPKMSVYAASKWAVLGWSESLRLELESISPSLHVTTITPSYIDTGMFEGVKTPLLAPLLSATKMADTILQSIKKNKSIVRRPRSVYLLPIMRGILPTKIFDTVIGKGFKIYSSMNEFVGREKSR